MLAERESSTEDTATTSKNSTLIAITNPTFCTCCKNDVFSCVESKYGPYLFEAMNEFVREKPYVSKEDIAKEYFNTYNSMFNVIDMHETGRGQIMKSRDPPICCYVGSHRKSLNLSNWNDDDVFGLDCDWI